MNMLILRKEQIVVGKWFKLEQFSYCKDNDGDVVTYKDIKVMVTFVSEDKQYEPTVYFRYDEGGKKHYNLCSEGNFINHCSEQY